MLCVGCLALVAATAGTPLAHGKSSRLVEMATHQVKNGKAFQKRAIRKEFAVPKGIEVPFRFWRDIYSAYDRSQVLIHDTTYLEIVYTVVDLSDISPRIDPFEGFPPEVATARLQRVNATMDQTRAALTRLAANPERADRTKFEAKVVQLFRHIPGGPEKFRAAAEGGRVRSQTGLRNRFQAGIVSSGKYMGTIETIFREEGVPWEISRLVFVESMFDLRAYSKVGASGIWQFMPATARLMGLTQNDIIDERNDPMAATRAAARLLKKNLESLGTWPLAINAYNSGPGRLRQAVRQLGTTSIATIIQRFSHPGYAFASRNFYPEFLAALDTFENREQYFGGKIAVAAPLEFDTVVTPKPVLLPQLTEHAQCDTAALWELNPGLTPSIHQGRKALPQGYVLKVPKSQSRTFLAAMDRLPGTAIATSQ